MRGIVYLILILGNLLYSFPVFSKTYKFEINQPRELDFASTEEVFKVRKKMIQAYPIFFSGNYNPMHSRAFKEVIDKKPWWGVKGMACYGPGEKGIAGVSEESRFIDNPFSLVSIEE